MREEQIERLDRITARATEIRAKLMHLAQAGTVHFRPTSQGITMVGLLPHRPQRGKSGYVADYLLEHFKTEFRTYCEDVQQGRSTPEKELQSFLISQAYQHDGRLEVLRSAAHDTEGATDPYFVTDELSMFTTTGKVVCDLLALRRDPHDASKAIPILIELKSTRQMAELVNQLERYSAVMIKYSRHFEELFGAILGDEVCFSRPIEKWLIWPALYSGTDRQERKLAQCGIRVVQYTKNGNNFTFHIGQYPASTSNKTLFKQSENK